MFRSYLGKKIGKIVEFYIVNFPNFEIGGFKI